MGIYLELLSPMEFLVLANAFRGIKKDAVQLQLLIPSKYWSVDAPHRETACDPKSMPTTAS